MLFCSLLPPCFGYENNTKIIADNVFLPPLFHIIYLWSDCLFTPSTTLTQMDCLNNSSSASIVVIHTNHVDMREHLIDFGKQHVITHDTVEMNIDALVYFRITDPRLAVLEVANLPDAIELLTQATLRNIIATMTLDDTFSSREKLNQELLFKMRPDAERWVGVFSFFFFFFFFIHYSFVITANTCTHFRIHPFLSFSFSFSFSRSILFLF